tara:strand:+ start:1180 stop:1587 length:408 start_codon:yes stop_codon:yes gene_type:complete
MLIIKSNFLDKLKTNPKKIFFIDAFGAFLTATSLFGILVQFEQYFGMPLEILYVLSLLAFFLFIYSIMCHHFIQSNFKPFLRVIIICNLIYSLVSLGLLINFYNRLTILGLAYFILELILIGILVFIEYKSYLKQ